MQIKLADEPCYKYAPVTFPDHKNMQCYWCGHPKSRHSKAATKQTKAA